MTDFERRCRRAAIAGSFTGVLLAVAMGIAFGVLDIQCRDNPQGPFWNANESRCQVGEVQP